jgi:hypothetical protein
MNLQKRAIEIYIYVLRVDIIVYIYLLLTRVEKTIKTLYFIQNYKRTEATAPS